MSNLKLGVILAVTALLVTFTIQNVAEIEITFLLWTMTIRRALLIFGVLGTGILIGWTLRGANISRKSEEASPVSKEEPSTRLIGEESKDSKED